MNLTYEELLRITEQRYTKKAKVGFIPAYRPLNEEVLKMPPAEQAWWKAVRRANDFWQNTEA